MRKVKFVPGEFYHIYNRSNDKQKIFLDKRDYIRFLFLILYFQSPELLHGISRRVTTFIKKGSFNVSSEKLQKILDKRTVELVAFTIMPNHFHLIVKELVEGGISKYLLKIQDAYTKYFNIKYSKTGHLFQGPFGAVLIKNNNQLLYLSTYTHRNSRSLYQWKDKEHLYPWSSYQDFVTTNRWGEFLKPEIVLDQFSSPEEYFTFTKKSFAKSKSLLGEEFLSPPSY